MVAFLVIAVGFSLLALSAAFVPVSALPRFAIDVVERRRSEVVVAGVAVVLSVSIGLLMALLT
jgi:hypothetical protein